METVRDADKKLVSVRIVIRKWDEAAETWEGLDVLAEKQLPKNWNPIALPLLDFFTVAHYAIERIITTLNTGLEPEKILKMIEPKGAAVIPLVRSEPRWAPSRARRSCQGAGSTSAMHRRPRVIGPPQTSPA